MSGITCELHWLTSTQRQQHELQDQLLPQNHTPVGALKFPPDTTQSLQRQHQRSCSIRHRHSNQNIRLFKPCVSRTPIRLQPALFLLRLADHHLVPAFQTPDSPTGSSTRAYHAHSPETVSGSVPAHPAFQTLASPTGSSTCAYHAHPPETAPYFAPAPSSSPFQSSRPRQNNYRTTQSNQSRSLTGHTSPEEAQ